MEIVTLSETNSLPLSASVVSVGNFDGVHRGHDLLIKEVVARSRKEKCSSVIVTFEPHTRTVLFPNAIQPILSTFEEKAVLIDPYGVDYLVCVPFTAAVAAMPADVFVNNYIINKCKAHYWVMGERHTFGKNHGGNKNFSHNSKGKNDIYINAVPSLFLDGRVISSTEIRAKIVEGRIDGAVVMLGHPYLMMSRRIAGVKKGSQLGYPTLNFINLPSNKVLPPPGIYAAEVAYSGRRWKGALYFGDCPTFENRDRHFEIHVFDYTGEEPEEGASACLWLHSWIREDRAFKDPQALTASIKRDVETIKKFFLREKEQCQ